MELARQSLKEQNPKYWEYEQRWLKGEIDNGIKVHFKLHTDVDKTIEVDHPLVPANTKEFEDSDPYYDLNELRAGFDPDSGKRSHSFRAQEKFKDITAKDRLRIQKALQAYYKLQDSVKKVKPTAKPKRVDRASTTQLGLFKLELMLFTHEHPEEGSKVIAWKGKQVFVCEYTGGKYCEYKGGRMLHAVYDTVDKWCYLPQE